MLTRSTKFSTYADRFGEQIDTIIRIIDGSDTYYFSYRPMPKGLDTNPIYPILQDFSGISEGVDIFNKRFRISDVTITLNDEPFYPNTGGLPIRVSELLSGINGSDIDIYFMAGTTIEDIDDCLHVFSGLILTSPILRENTMSFSAKDKSKLNDIVLPQRLIEDVFTSTPTDLRGNRIPLVYGKFYAGTTHDDLFDYVGTGLARAIAYEDKLYSKNAVADHDITQMYATNEFCVNFGGPTPVPAAYHTGGLDTGIYYRQLTSGQYGLYLIFNVEADMDGIYDDESYTAVNAENAETNASTKCDLYDNYLDDGSDAKGLGLWYFKRNTMFSKHIQAGGELQGMYGGLVAGDYTEGEITKIVIYLYYGRESGSDERIEFGNVEKPNIDFGLGGGSLFSDEDITSGSFSTDIYGTVYAVAFEAQSTNMTTPDGVTNNDIMVQLGILQVKMKFIINTRPDTVWIACKGRYFGSWIDDASRSNTFNSGDAIEHPNYIIESLYREEVGLTDSDIDMGSFDNAYDADVEARINITDETTLSEIVQRLSEQSKFVICYTGAGKLRAIPLDETSPSISATIERSHIIDDSISIQKTDHIINQMVVESRWQGENSRYIDIDLYQDTSSQTEYRVRAASFQWPNICGDSAQEIAEHYVNSTDGLWSKEHIVVEFKTIGYRYAHLQAGDWVQLTSDFDSIREPFGDSWVNKNLLISDIKKTPSYVEMTLIEISPASVGSPSPSPSPEPSPSPVSPVVMGLWDVWDSTPTSGTLGEEPDLVDDNISVWCCKSIGKEYSIGIDMGESSTLSVLRIYDDGSWGSGTSGTPVLKLYTSNDNSTWTYKEQDTTITRIATGGTNDPYYIDFIFSTSYTARYFKLYASNGPILSASGYAILFTEIDTNLDSLSPSPSPSI